MSEGQYLIKAIFSVTTPRSLVHDLATYTFIGEFSSRGNDEICTKSEWYKTVYIIPNIR